MIISILACTGTGGIGNRGTLPWPHNKEDLQWFKQHTDGNIVVMGRNTWDDPKMPKPLPNRVNVVVSNKPIADYQVRRLSGDICEQVLELQKQFPSKDVYIIGGKQIYETTADIVNRVILTRMKGNYWSDTRLQLDRYLAPFRIRSVTPSANCTYEIWDREMFFKFDTIS